jgi:hypothetical protein
MYRRRETFGIFYIYRILVALYVSEYKVEMGATIDNLDWRNMVQTTSMRPCLGPTRAYRVGEILKCQTVRVLLASHAVEGGLLAAHARKGGALLGHLGTRFGDIGW